MSVTAPKGYVEGYIYIDKHGNYQVKPEAPDWAVKEAEECNQAAKDAKERGFLL